MKKPTHFILIFWKTYGGGTELRNEVAYSLERANEIAKSAWEVDNSRRVVVTKYLSEHKPDMSKW